MISLLQRLADDQPEDPNAEWEIKSNWIIEEIRMLFDSRPRFPGVADIPDINKTVINYGLEEGFASVSQPDTRTEILRQRIFHALASFESRLFNVDVAINNAQLPRMEFTVNAEWNDQFLSFSLIWDDAMSTFYLNEMA